MTNDDKPTLNRPLLLNTLAKIEAHPELWDQSAWAQIFPTKPFKADDACGTSFCFAGHALVDAGFRPYTKGLNFPNDWDQYDGDPDDDGRVSVHYFVKDKTYKKILKKGYVPTIDDKYDAESEAQEQLGLTYGEASELFNADNNLQKLREIVADLITSDR